MAYDKGVFHLVEAMRQVWAEGTSARLVLAGAVLEPMRRFWLGLPEECRQRILLLDGISEADKLDLLAAGDVFAMPSRTDAFGIVYLEAWSYAKPVIGAAAGGVPDVIQHEQDGLLVPFGDVPALAASIERLLRDPLLMRALGERGRAKVLAEYTWDKTFAVVNRLYEELTGSSWSAGSTDSTPVSA
jgi:glycosyltransferase involved in cell wall biosynthesis